MRYIVKRAYWVFAFCVGAAIPAVASERVGNPTAGAYIQLAQATQGGISKSKAADIAKAAHGGKVLKVEETSRAGEKIYRVKLLLNGGRIKIVTVDGRTGQLL